MTKRHSGMGKAIWMVLALSLLVMLTAGFLGEAQANPLKEKKASSAAVSVSDASHPGAVQTLQDSFDSIYKLGEKAVQSGSPIRVVLKWQGELERRDAGAETEGIAVERLANDLGLVAPQDVAEERHATYRSSAELKDQLSISLFWSELGEGRSYVIVTVESKDLLKAVDFKKIAVEAGRLMLEQGINADWNVSLQGTAKKQDNAEQAVQRLEGDLLPVVPGTNGAEDYADTATFSRSYTVPVLDRFVMSGDQRIGMQAAIHQDDVSGKNRVTLGFPLITIEY